MEVRYLLYKGNKKEGTVIVRQVKANSPWRKLPYSLGMRLKVGEQIPELIADFVVTNFPTLFGFETVKISPADALEDQINNLVSSYLDDLEPNEIQRIEFENWSRIFNTQGKSLSDLKTMLFDNLIKVFGDPEKIDETSTAINEESQTNKGDELLKCPHCDFTTKHESGLKRHITCSHDNK